MDDEQNKSGVFLADIVEECTKTLKPDSFKDAPGAVNGLQMANKGRIRHIVAAVDASLSTIRMAVERKADLMLVHHGLFWGKTAPWTGRVYELMDLMIGNNLALYSSHLPLDAHPELGNNAGLAKALGLQNPKPFFYEGTTAIGFQYQTDSKRQDMQHKLTDILGQECLLIPGGPKSIKKVGIVTGGAGNELTKAAAEGVDSFITGEGAHWTYALAEDAGINVFYGGHYATETFGVKSLAAYLCRQFNLTWEFIDYPTGL